MGLSSLFSKEGRRERSLLKNCAKAANKLIKPDDRRPALYALMDDPCAETTAGLLKRFTFVYESNSVMDEEEKNFVYDGLVARGAEILMELKQHLKTSSTLSWGLKLLNEVVDAQTRWEAVAELLANYDPGYVRDPSRKDQLMTFLGEIDDERAVEALIPFLEDHDEGVRFTTIEALFRHNNEAARDPLLKLLTSEEDDSLRLKHRIAEGFAETNWTTKGFRGTVERLVTEQLTDYVVDGKGHIKHKKAVKG